MRGCRLSCHRTSSAISGWTPQARRLQGFPHAASPAKWAEQIRRAGVELRTSRRQTRKRNPTSSITTFPACNGYMHRRYPIAGPGAQYPTPLSNAVNSPLRPACNHSPAVSSPGLTSLPPIDRVFLRAWTSALHAALLNKTISLELVDSSPTLGNSIQDPANRAFDGGRQLGRPSPHSSPASWRRAHRSSFTHCANRTISILGGTRRVVFFSFILFNWTFFREA